MKGIASRNSNVILAPRYDVLVNYLENVVGIICTSDTTPPRKRGLSTFHGSRSLSPCFKQVCMVTPMDRATLLYARSTIPRCTPSVINWQQSLRAIFKAHCYTDQQLSVISTYVHDEAQATLSVFVVDTSLEQIQ